MQKAEKIEDFIKSVFEVYSLDYGQYFSDYTEDDEKVEIPMVIDGELDMEMVHQAAEILGENVDDLLSMNSKNAAKWQNRFSYIEQRHFFEYACHRSYYADSYDVLRLMEVLWDIHYPKKPMRFDYKSVTQRMKALLKEYDKTLPGTYHPEAEIQSLQIKTATFCHYGEFDSMIASFFEMVDRANILFFKALDQELSAEEIREYNIIVSILGIRDRYAFVLGELHYKKLRKLAPIYKAEQQPEFLDYVMLDPAKDIAPWRCMEFTQNRETVQRYMDIVPGAKKAMRDYAALSSQFLCTFVWSDAAQLHYPPICDNNRSEMNRMLQHIRMQYAYGGLEPTSIYVPKTPNELGNDGTYSDILKQLTGPAAKGGIAISPKPKGKANDPHKAMSRIAAIYGGRHE